MRSDFYYRVNVIPIHLVPLRQRKVDIPLLVHDFLRHHPIAAEKRINTISKHVVNVLMDYAWPGNIRELQNVLERAIVLAAGHIIDAVDLPDLMSQPQPKENGAILCASLDEWMREQEKRFLEQKLGDFGGNVALTAKSCGIGLRTLSRKIRLHRLDPKSFRRKATTSKIDMVKRSDRSPLSRKSPHP
jgi:transcriptional regulator with PAS, ATPase and Fis domain